MTKFVLLDIDGVLLTWNAIFSKVYAKEHNIDYQKILDFFHGEFQECTVGKKDLKVILKPYLQEWNWQGTVDEFLKYWFESELILNEPIAEMAKWLREKGVRVYLASNQEQYRTEYLKELLKIDEKFDGIFVSCQIGARKDSPEFFEKVIEKIGCLPQDAMLIDDDPENVEVAERSGLKGLVYTTDVGIEKIKKMIV